MFSAQLVRKSKRNYPGIITKVEGPWLTLAATEVKASAKRDVPVDTGNLRGSINEDVQLLRHQAVVGTNVDYAQHVEYGWQRGNRRYKGKSYLRAAIDKNRRGLLRQLATMIRNAIRRG